MIKAHLDAARECWDRYLEERRTRKQNSTESKREPSSQITQSVEEGQEDVIAEEEEEEFDDRVG